MQFYFTNYQLLQVDISLKLLKAGKHVLQGNHCCKCVLMVDMPDSNFFLRDSLIELVRAEALDWLLYIILVN
jgi:predicted protein tyrosine phosphatase